MAVTKYTLDGDVSDQAGEYYAVPKQPVIVLVQANSDAVLDQDNNLVQVGTLAAEVDLDGTWAVELIATDSADVNPPSGRRYRVIVDWPEPAGKYDRYGDAVYRRKRWHSGWFTLTADRNLADIDDALDVDPGWRTEFMDQAQELLDAQIAISGIDDTDSAVAALIEDPLVGPLTTDALADSYAAVFTPEGYGALGDGTTDDTTAIQAALTAARTAQGVVRFKPTKTYIVNGALNPAGTKVEGRGATLKINPATTPAYSVLTPTAACVIEDLTVDLNKANTTDPANQAHGNGLLMNVASWDGLVVRNVTVRDGHQIGVQILSTNGGNDGDAVTYCRTLLENVTVESCDEANYSIKTVAGVTLRDCRSLDATAAGFYLSVVGRSHVLGCQSLDGGGSGIFLEYCQDVTVADGVYEGNATQGIAVGGGSDTLRENRNITVIGNVVRNNGSIGITVDPTKAAALNTWVAVYSTVSNNLCEDNGAEGINIENAGHVAVTGNVCHSNTGTGLRILGAYVAASGNVLTGNTQYGLALYGVAAHDNGHHSIGVNTVLGNTAGQYDWAAVTSGVVLDVVNRFPGSVRSQHGLHAAIDTGQETWMGAAGPGGEAGINIYGEYIYRPSIGLLRTPSHFLVQGNLAAGYNGAGDWDEGHLLIGGYHLWVDSTGDLRIKSGAPSSDTDGTVVGTQS